LERTQPDSAQPRGNNQKREASAGADANHEGPRFFRKRGAIHFIPALPFLGACLGSVILLILYHWPSANVPVYYFTVRPAVVWFALLTPLLVSGLIAIRRRWFLLGLTLWFLCLAGSEEIVQCFKPFPDRARTRFQNARMACWSYMEQSNGDVKELSVPLRIVTWNIRCGFDGAAEVVRDLERLDPDVVFLQEYIRGGMPEVDKAFARSEHFAKFHWPKPARPILSRYPIRPLETDTLDPFLGMVCRLEIAPGMEVTCVNAHLSPAVLKTHLLRGWSRTSVADAISRARDELEQLRRTLEVHGAEGAVVLAGDFNLPANYADLPIAVSGLQDCFSANGYGWGKTAPARLPLTRIDLIYVPRSAEVLYACAVPTAHSDHCMALAEVLLPVTRGADVSTLVPLASH